MKFRKISSGFFRHLPIATNFWALILRKCGIIYVSLLSYEQNQLSFNVDSNFNCEKIRKTFVIIENTYCNSKKLMYFFKLLFYLLFHTCYLFTIVNMQQTY